MAKKKAVGKARTAKRTATRSKKATTPSPPAEPAEINAKTLSPDDARRRCDSIYRLESARERKLRFYDSCRAAARSAKRAFKEADEALQKEINEQRFGPGPLFSPDGKGAAK